MAKVVLIITKHTGKENKDVKGHAEAKQTLRREKYTIRLMLRQKCHYLINSSVALSLIIIFLSLKDNHRLKQ